MAWLPRNACAQGSNTLARSFRLFVASRPTSKLRVSRLVAFFLVVAAARWLYGPALNYDFTFDDWLGVRNNADVDTSR